MTPLFPENEEKISMKQGQTGDCYLLASLDCIFNSGDEGLNKVKSLFTETMQGVTVRIRQNSYSTNLSPDRLNVKYTYSLDSQTNEDVFEISKDKMQEIDQNVHGVESNSLAVKILEHISSYYYNQPLDLNSPDDSVLAHNRKKRFGGYPAEFVGKLIGINAQRVEINEIIKLQTITPSPAIYMQMLYGEADSNGVIHVGHAFRVLSVAKQEDFYKFTVVNPWDNNKEEIFTYSLETLKTKHCTFSKFLLPKQELNKELSNCKEEDREFVSATPALFNLLLEACKRNFHVTREEIESCIKLYMHIPNLHTLINSLPLKEQYWAISHILSAQDKTTFIKTLITNFPSIDIIRSMMSLESCQDDLVDILVDSVLTNPLTPLHSILITHEFFSLVLSTAISHKKSRLDEEKPNSTECNQSKAKDVVEEGLISYFFMRDSNHITDKAGLRAFFNASVFTEANIKSSVKPEAFLAFAIVQIIDKSEHSEYVIEQIQNSDSILINEALLDKILNSSTTKATPQLFEGLKRLSDLNINLATKLFPLLVKKLDCDSNRAWIRFNGEHSELIEWFEKMLLSDSERSQAAKVMGVTVKKVTTPVDISFFGHQFSESTTHTQAVYENWKRIPLENAQEVDLAKATLNLENYFTYVPLENKEEVDLDKSNLRSRKTPLEYLDEEDNSLNKATLCW